MGRHDPASSHPPGNDFLHAIDPNAALPYDHGVLRIAYRSLKLKESGLHTLAVGVYSFQGENFTEWSDMAAASTISLLPVIAVFLFLQRYFIEGLAGAVKQ